MVVVNKKALDELIEMGLKYYPKIKEVDGISYEKISEQAKLVSPTMFLEIESFIRDAIFSISSITKEDIYSLLKICGVTWDI